MDATFGGEYFAKQSRIVEYIFHLSQNISQYCAKEA